jgi:AsmA protein
VTSPVGKKGIGYFALLLAIAALATLFSIAYLMPAQAVREAVQAEIRAVTGLDPVLRGAASVSLFPTGRVSLDDVSLSDSTGAPALTAQRVLARLRFFPLLVGRVQISEITLLRPVIAITLNSDRRSNWSGHLDALAQNLASPRARGSSFSEIRIEDGTILFRDESGRTLDTLSKVEIALAWPSISNSFAATGRFVWRGEGMDGSISLADFATALRGERSGVKLRLAGSPFKLAFDGYLSYRPTLKMEGTVAADAASLREALRWAGQRAPVGGGFGRFALKAHANVVGTTIGLSSANVQLDGNVGEGVLAFDGRHSVQGTLAADGLDMTPYLSKLRLMGGPQADADSAHGWSNQAIVLDSLDGMDIDLRVSAARVTIGNARLGRTAVAANLRGGSFHMAIGESEAFGGVVRGTVGLGKASQGAEFKAQLQFANVDLEQCLGEMFGIRRLEGKGNVGFAVESAGVSVYDLTKTMNGTANLLSRKGAIAGLNIEQLLRRIERRPLSGAGEFRLGKTPYETLSVNLNIVDGVANVEQVRMEGVAVGLGMTGTASIPARELDLRGTASLLSGPGENAGPPLFELPFMVQGSWDDPIMLPDPQSRLQRSGAAAPLLEGTRGTGDTAGEIRDRERTIRSTIDRLTGATAQEPTAR